MQGRIVLLSIILLLSLGCLPEGESQEQPTQIPNQTPTTIPTSVATLPPLPAFPAEMDLFALGGAGGGSEVGVLPPNCDYFALPAVSSVIGGTTYPRGKMDLDFGSDPGDYIGLAQFAGTYPRGAELCLGGVPKDKQIKIKLISLDQKVTLRTVIQIVDDTSSQGNFTLSGDASGYVGSKDGHIWADLSLWWAGALESGTWKVEASWPGKTIYGNFYAKTRSLPEISFGDPDFSTKLFPITAGGLFVCRTAPSEQPFVAVLEAFPPNTPIYVLVYGSDRAREGYSIDYRTITYSDEFGMGEVRFPANFNSGYRYYVLAFTNPSTEIAQKHDEFTVLNFPAIANALDCIDVP